MSLDTCRNSAQEQEFVVEGLPLVIGKDIIDKYGDTYIIRKDSFDDLYVLTEDEED